ncbi:MAG TPA: GNAT family N-acetyltransferase [Candidatus Acidoferrales bacterium]|nr:GNAT family N-acetyltransferase [Candidatus Acidoferrales bacterium]
MNRTTTSIEVRAAAKKDVEALARLAGELGYPSTAAEVRKRLDAVEADPHHAAFVAAAQNGALLGWIELSETRSLAHDTRAEITALVVDSMHRGAGVGRRLVETGETWARERGVGSIGVRSNVLRDRAHEFYLGLGYAVTKSQKVFRKTL